jgi:hypothetical protein
MKKFFITFLCSLSVLIAHAQVEEGASAGVRAGVNFSFIDIQHASESFAPGLSIGFFSKATLKGKFSFQPELSASLQNADVTLDESIGGGKLRLSLYYVETAFSGVYNISEHISVHAGAFISYLFQYKINNESAEQDFIDDYISRKNFYDINLGLVAGAAYEFRRFDTGVRMNFGMFTIGKDNTQLDYSPYVQTKNSFFQFYGAYIF